MLFSWEVHMSEEDLELLITLDEPWDGHEDTFNHQNDADQSTSVQPPPRRRQGQRTEVIVGDESSK